MDAGLFPLVKLPNAFDDRGKCGRGEGSWSDAALYEKFDKWKMIPNFFRSSKQQRDAGVRCEIFQCQGKLWS